MSRIREVKNSKLSNNSEQHQFGVIRRQNNENNNERENGRRKNDELINENWEKDSYLLSDLIGNTTVCIHCMTNKCKKTDDPEHPNIFFPRKFTELINYPAKLNELSKVLRRNPIKDNNFGDFKLYYTICLYNLCNGKCKGFLAGRHGKFNLDDGTEIIYCYPELDRIRNNHIFIGLHIDVKLTNIENKINIESFPLQIELKKNPSIIDEQENDNISINSNISKASNINKLNQNVKKEWVNVLNKNINNNSNNELEDAIYIESKKNKELNIDIDENNNNGIENLPTTKDLYENIENSENSVNIEKNNNENINKVDTIEKFYERFKNFGNHSCDFFDYQYEENNKLHDKIKNLEEKVDKLISINNRLIHHIENKNEVMMKKLIEASKECNNSVSEQVMKTEFNKYFHFT